MSSQKQNKNKSKLCLPVVEDRDLIEARKILGDLVKNWPDERLRDEVAGTKYLVETWLDDFERKTFDGKTLSELVPGFNSYKTTED